MINITGGFSGFSVDDIPKAQDFYGEILGLKADVDENMGTLNVTLGEGHRIFIYPKPNHEPATFTVLNFFVGGINESVVELENKGVILEKYEGMHQDEKGIASGGPGPKIAWFKDPAGNILSLIEGKGF